MKSISLKLPFLIAAFALIVLTGCEKVTVIPDLPQGTENPIKVLNEDNFRSTIATGNTAVFFTTDACQSCQEQEVLLEIAALSQDWEMNLEFGKVNYQDATQIFLEQNITEMPTLLFYRDGRRVSELRSDYEFAHDLSADLQAQLNN